MSFGSTLLIRVMIQTPLIIWLSESPATLG
nr:MAG TPA: hypothetical protein [Caudoviricetes sp.]